MPLTRSDRKQMEVTTTIYSVMCSIEVVGNYMPTTQTYDDLEPTYAPDYSIDKLSLFPRCQVIDPDSPIAAITCNPKLKSFEWFEATSAGLKAIYSGGKTADGYEVIESGDNKGQLSVGKNGKVGQARAVRFVGIYVEDGYSYKFEASMPLPIIDASSPGTELSIDSDKAIVYNPLRAPENQTIVAKVIKGNKDITSDDRCKLLWYRRNSSGAETLLTANPDCDNIEVVGITKSPNGSITSLTINRSLIGNGQTYGVYAMYRSNKQFPSAPTDLDARLYTTITRGFPRLYCEIKGDGLMTPNVKAQHMKVIVSDNQGVIPNWNKHLYASWKVTKDGTETEVARGEEVMLPITSGASFECDIEDRGTRKVIASDTGEWLVDGDGSPITIREYEDE